MSNKRSRNWVFTLNNYEPNHCTDLLALYPDTVRYVCFGKETAPTTGTRHLQGFVVFPNARRANSVRTTILGAHVELARGNPAQCKTYCQKDGDFFEAGELPATPQDNGDAERDRWATALDLCRKGDLESIDP